MFHHGAVLNRERWLALARLIFNSSNYKDHSVMRGLPHAIDYALFPGLRLDHATIPLKYPHLKDAIPVA